LREIQVVRFGGGWRYAATAALAAGASAGATWAFLAA
jgi:ubiquinone biosynthesis protein